MAAKRAEQSRLGGALGGRPEPGRSGYVEVIAPAEKKQEARAEAEVIRVANGGAGLILTATIAWRIKPELRRPPKNERKPKSSEWPGCCRI
jgi:hypothetical protein